MKNLIPIILIRFHKLHSRNKVLFLSAVLLVIVLGGIVGYTTYRSHILTKQGDSSLRSKQYIEAAHYYRSAGNINIFDKSALKKATLCDRLQQSQAYYKLALGELGRKQFTSAVTNFHKVEVDSPLYNDAKQQELQINIVIQSLVVSGQHYRQGVNAYNSQLWVTASNEFSQVIQIDPNYADAQTKTKIATIHLGVPRIVSAAMTKTVGSQSEAVAPTSTFSASDTSFYLSMQLGAVLKSTKLEYTRYYGSAYVDSGVAYASSDYPQYFSFFWQKKAYTYPKGDYHIKLYLNGYYQTTVNYSVQ